MNTGTLIRAARMVNEGRTIEADVLFRHGVIDRIATEGIGSASSVDEVRAEGMLLLPGAIDDQVHFREPGLTHKEDIAHGSAAAVAGGVTSFMEMPNTDPQTLTQELLTAKYALGAASSVANYSFYMGVGNTNMDEVLRTDPRSVCGLKAFLGSSTGNMLVDAPGILERLFREAHMLLAVHAEHEPTIRSNMAAALERWGEGIPMEQHPMIRSEEACYRSSSMAVALAKEHGTRLHVLHISTARELDLFTPGPLENKRITAEACVHHLWFTDADYATKGALLKWNPAVKRAADRDAVRQAVRDGRIDVVATDHAPHTLEEKARPYAQCPSGGPLVQHSLVAMLELARQGQFTVEEVVEKMCHAPARMFQVERRGYLREGYQADAVLVDPNAPWTVDRTNVISKCGWSPFEGQQFHTRVLRTWVNGQLAYANGQVNDRVRGERLSFDR
ncbi:MAG: dihydroorotase [Flavobacteriales bacterium]|jgi:dihydroorotase|nr:dihydroorotase [Flavobacteriales bacterium]MBK6755991.1 dihydroorotase [Flavobacteriales bacterium]MBK7086480.1 dihydroorotase [Flavobacteriales bacterium]MBK9074172.1 dihydroorotase [Flavobacteriales bacterium]MBK9539777.1 dihydroorotase [Flavobacteriales bacterium]